MHSSLLSRPMRALSIYLMGSFYLCFHFLPANASTLPSSQQTLVEKAPATSPANDPQAAFAQGQAALQSGDLASAEAAFRRVLSIDPQSGAAYANLGVIAMRRKEWDHALSLLRKAEKLEPKMSGIRLNIGLVKYRRGDYNRRPSPRSPLSSTISLTPRRHATCSAYATFSPNITPKPSATSNHSGRKCPTISPTSTSSISPLTVPAMTTSTQKP